MVLVSNEWQIKKDDDQKPNITLPTSHSGAVIATALSNGTTTDTDTGLSKTTWTESLGGVSPIVKKKYSQHTTNIEAEKNIEQDQLFKIMEMTADSKHDIVNQENNIQIPDINTKTLQGSRNIERRMTAQMPAAASEVLHMAMNTNNAGVGVTTASNILSLLGAQREHAMECSTLLATPEVKAASVNSSKESGSATLSCTGDAKIILECEPKSHKFDTRSILLQPNHDCKVGRLIAKSKASEGNAIFDCKVLSRNHAILWYTPDGRFWVKDTKSSNGTFINDNKLGNDPAELHYGDTVKFGVEVIENSRQEVHGCIIARVSLFFPDGREAISIEANQMQLAGPNRISFDEIQRLNSFLQEAAQREKALKAKLSSLQCVLDTTRKNSTMCWQSMITEDQLLHKINLLEKKLQMMEKNIPENTLRTEVIKLLEDKTTYQLTAKEALRKVYQERCDAIQMLSKMEMAYATSENECGILRSQILTSKQTLQDFNARLEQLQQEYIDYKQESLRQQHEAKKQEERSLELLKEKLSLQERELEELRLQVTRVQQATTGHENEQLQNQNQLNSITPDDDVWDKKQDAQDEKANLKISDDGGLFVPQGHVSVDIDQHRSDSGNQTQDKKLKLSTKELSKIDSKPSIINLLRNSDLCKGEDGSAVLNAIFYDDVDSDSEKKNVNVSDVTTELYTGIKEEAAENVYDPLYERYNAKNNQVHKLESQEMIVRCKESLNIQPDFPTEQADKILQEECDIYREKTVDMTGEMYSLQEQVELLKNRLEHNVDHKNGAKLQIQKSKRGNCQGINEKDWNEDLATINNLKVKQEEELIVYKELLEDMERSNIQLRNEILELHLKQQHMPNGKQMLLHRVLPLGCCAIALLIYLISNRI
ncbi:sarcolemmal membrane-associated protein [Drosophila eugracilis]|uniref:sarcolemmal membrane-associated protein n=1 Tax=Drosophila eugracilis TaxID=29029 RepID=UPI0007E7F505|nr:sarcolemmal membrane-associated protein [Drosophila eugracilis]XP_017086145.1 sarcolemmal membrane-associated protein [Drosophila eugracilis]